MPTRNSLVAGLFAVLVPLAQGQPVKLQFNQVTIFPGMTSSFVTRSTVAPNGSFVVAISGQSNGRASVFVANYSRSGTRNWLTKLVNGVGESDFAAGVAASSSKVFVSGGRAVPGGEFSLVGVFDFLTGALDVIHTPISGPSIQPNNVEVGPNGEAVASFTREEGGLGRLRTLRFDAGGGFLSDTELNASEEQSFAGRCAFGVDGRVLVSGIRIIGGVRQGLLFNIGRSVGVISSEGASVRTFDVAPVPNSTDNVTVGSIGDGQVASHLVVTRLRQSGATVWRTEIPGNLQPERVFVDPSGNVITCSNLRVGNENQTHLAKFNGGTGAVVWSRSFPGGGPASTMDAHGEVYVVGVPRQFFKVSGTGVERFRLTLGFTGGCVSVHGASGDVFVGGLTGTSAGLNIFRQAPVAIADGFVARRNATYRSPRALTTNDRNFQGAIPSVVTPPANGTLTLGANGLFTYRPNDNFVGQDTWRYKLSKAGLTESTAQVTMTVTN